MVLCVLYTDDGCRCYSLLMSLLSCEVCSITMPCVGPEAVSKWVSV